MTSPTELSWQRLPWLSLLYFFGKTLYQLYKNITNIAPAVAGILVASDTIREQIFIWGPAALVATVLLGGALQYWYFKFCIANQQVQVHSGVFKRTQLSLDYARIQQAEVLKPFYFRPFKLTILSLDSAGSSSNEVKLAGLPAAAAWDLRDDILAVRTDTPVKTQTQQSDTASIDTPTIEIKLPLIEVSKYGVMNTRVLVVVAALFGVLFQFEGAVEAFADQVEAQSEQLQAALGLWLWALLILVGASVLLIGSIAYAIFRYYGFVLRIDERGQQAQSGLLSISSVGIRHVKLQSIQWRQNTVARALDRVTLKLRQVSGFTMNGPQKTFLVPVLTPAQQHQINAFHRVPTGVWQGISRWAQAPVLLIWLVITVCATLFWSIDWWQKLGIIVIAMSMIAIICWALWRRTAYHFDGQWLGLHSGFIGTAQKWYPAYKIQHVVLSEPPWQRLAGKASVYVATAAGIESIAWLPKNEAEQLMQNIMGVVTAHKGRWM